MALTSSPIAERELLDRLRTAWGVCPISVTQMFAGHGGDTWTFRADSADDSYFLKLKKAVSEPGVAISLLLADRHIPAIAPLLSTAGNAWEPLSGFQLLVYPLIVGRAIEPASLTDIDWYSLGASLKAVHNMPLPEALKSSLATDTFIPWGQDFLSKIEPAIAAFDTEADSVQQQFGRLWSAQASMPLEFLSFLRTQGQTALASAPVFCLCHADFQVDNILKSAPGILHILDWDNPMWAPPERDLMFVAPEFRPQFLTGYGPITLNEPVMAYLISDWLLQDTFDCVDRILFAGSVGLEEKQWALDLICTNLPKMKSRLDSNHGARVSIPSP